MAWRINKWKQFEPPAKNDRKQEGELKWWKCPVSQNRRYKMLATSGPKGWEMLGIWHAIVASWGRQNRESRKGGVLRTALAGDSPASLSELAIDTLIPPAKLKAAIAKLLEMGWLCLESNGNPEGEEMESETKLDETRLNKTRQEEKKPPAPKLKFADNVSLSVAEHAKLLDKYGTDATDKMIEKLDNFKGSGGKKYKSDYHAILTWVVDWWKKEGRDPDAARREMIAKAVEGLGDD